MDEHHDQRLQAIADREVAEFQAGKATRLGPATLERKKMSYIR